MIGYPSLNKDYSLHLTPAGGFICGSRETARPVQLPDYANFNPFDGRMPVLSIMDMRRINISAVEFLCCCDGSLSFDAIIAQLQEHFKVDKDRVIECISEFTDTTVQNDHITLLDEPCKQDIRMTGSKEALYPVHAVIELTDTCNLTCRYCYRDAEFFCNAQKTKTKFVPLDRMIEMCKILHTNGVKIIELSGGEPSLYPHAAEVINYCSEHFGLVSLVTNGTCITEDIAEQIAKAMNIVIGLSLDGACEETVDHIAGVPGTFERVCEGLKLLVKNDLFIRVGMTVTRENMNEMEDTLLLAKDIGVTAFTMSLPSPIGRAKANEDYELEHDEISEIMETMARLKQEHEQFMATMDNVREDQYCGAGKRSIAVSPDGDIRACALGSHNELMHLGNLWDDGYHEIFHGEISKFYQNVPYPSPEECEGCNLQAFCNRCFVRAATVIGGNVTECKWAQKNGFYDFVDKHGLPRLTDRSDSTVSVV
jgi:radical SAM protein with 4Fe4S-binding SPASM domain